MTLIILTLIILFVISLFSSPKLSPIPYFPTNKKDIPLILKALKLKNNQIIIDLGAGDGVVIFASAKTAFEKKLNTQFVAIEINPILVIILNLRRLFHSNKKNIKIVWGNMFKINLKTQILNLKSKSQNSNLPTIYLYISPWLIEKTVFRILQQLPKANFVSYMYPIKSLVQKSVFTGKNKIFYYDSN